MIKQFLAKIVLVALTFLGINVQPITQVQEVTKAPIVSVQAPVKFGSSIPNTPALVDTYLASSITNTATALTLASGSTNDGTVLAGFMCFTLDANTPQVEYVCGTASSTAVTNVTRGIDFTNPNATTTKTYTHRRFSTVQATDYPTIQFIQRKLNGTDTFDGIMSYTTASTTGAFTNAKQIISKGYVDGIVIAGGVVANETTPGISQLATQGQTASGTATSGAYSLIPQNKYFNATSSATTTVPVTKTNGKLDTSFIDQTEVYNWTGAHTFASTTTFTASSTPIFNATTTFNIRPIGATWFGGTGADGALSITSGTTTIDLGGLSVFTKNYSSISITGTSSLAFTNANANGTAIILRSSGNVVLTSTANPIIDLRNLGGAGGATGNQHSGIATNNIYFVSAASGGGNAASSAGAGGAVNYSPSNLYSYLSTTTLPISSGLGSILFAGGGGGSGGVVNSGTSGAGGKGAGGLYIEVGGSLNFTGTINATGANGTNGSAPGGSAASGGGGGGGGSVAILYNSLVSNTGTINVSGGTGGNCDSAGWGNSYGGGGGSNDNVGGGGGSANGNGTQTGGNGANGFSIVAQNTIF